MIICFDCTPESKRDLDVLLKHGDYESYSEIINLAIANLSILQNRVPDGSSMIIDQNLSQDRKRIGDLPAKYLKPRKPETSIITNVPEIFILDLDKDFHPPLAPNPLPQKKTNEDYPFHTWIFGQYNRFLPIKATCRGIENLLRSGNASGVPLSTILESIPNQAKILGNYLFNLESSYSLLRDQKLSIAFPNIGSGSEKSQQRFANQFVASINKNGDLSGMPYDFGFINWFGESKSRISLTEQGWKFSQLSNPILDNVQVSPNQKYSKQELDFLITHIIDNIPSELSAYRKMINGIKKGYASPKLLSDFFEDELKENQSIDYTKTFLSTQRSGVISRMIDLNLIAREREGKFVQYVITDLASKYDALFQ